MVTDLGTYLAFPYTTVVRPDQTTEGGTVYLASNPELPGCMAHGQTPEEALQNLADARELYIRTALERGIAVPMPSHQVVKTITLTTSGPVVSTASAPVWSQDVPSACGPAVTVQKYREEIVGAT